MKIKNGKKFLKNVEEKLRNKFKCCAICGEATNRGDYCIKHRKQEIKNKWN